MDPFDPEFLHVLFRVMGIGGLIAAIGLIALIAAFRTLAPADGRERDFQGSMLIVIVLALVMVACGVLLVLSIVRT
jgi:hypothetical protein